MPKMVNVNNRTLSYNVFVLDAILIVCLGHEQCSSAGEAVGVWKFPSLYIL